MSRPLNLQIFRIAQVSDGLDSPRYHLADELWQLLAAPI